MKKKNIDDIDCRRQLHREFSPTLSLDDSMLAPTCVCRVMDGVSEIVPISDDTPDFVFNDCTTHKQIQTGVDFGTHHPEPSCGLEGALTSERIVNQVLSDPSLSAPQKTSVNIDNTNNSSNDEN